MIKTNTIKHEIQLNFGSSDVKRTVIKQNSTDTHILIIKLYDKNNKLSIDTSWNISISAIKGDNTHVLNSTNISIVDNAIHVTMTRQMLAASGTEKCELLIQEGEKTLYSDTFLIYVEPNVQDGSFLESSDECDVIADTLNKVSGYEEQARNKKNEIDNMATEIAGTKEDIDDTYSKLQAAVTNTSNLITENQKIAAAEEARATAETTRQNNETIRQTNTSAAIQNAETATERANNAAENCENIIDGTGLVKSSEKGQPNGVAELNENGFVPTSQLPSFVDDVIEGYLYNNTFYKDSNHTIEVTAESGKIYVDLTNDVNKIYRWSGTTFVVISDTISLGETSSTAYRGDRGKIAYNHAQEQHAPYNAQKNVQADWSETDTSSDAYIKNKPSTIVTDKEITAKSIKLTSTSAPGSADNVYSIQTAPASIEHLCIGKNRIQAFGNSGNPGTLYLNFYGGNVSIGNDSNCGLIEIGSKNTQVNINGTKYIPVGHIGECWMSTNGSTTSSNWDSTTINNLPVFETISVGKNGSGLLTKGSSWSAKINYSGYYRIQGNMHVTTRNSTDRLLYLFLRSGSSSNENTHSTIEGSTFGALRLTAWEKVNVETVCYLTSGTYISMGCRDESGGNNIPTHGCQIILQYLRESQ